MRQPTLTELGFDIATLRFDALATLRALCGHFEPDQAAGLHFLLNAAEYVQRTVIGPPEIEPRTALTQPPSALAEGCVELDRFDEPSELAVMLTESGWPTAIQELWIEDDAESFASTGRSVIAITFERSVRVTVEAPDPARAFSALIERGKYLACASGERLFFTDAICRLPLGRDYAELDLTAIPGFWVGSLGAACDTCTTRWRVETSGDFHELGGPTDTPAWNFFEEAADLAYISATFGCLDLACEGRVALELS